MYSKKDQSNISNEQYDKTMAELLNNFPEDL
jgi:hypothetical protein